MKIKNFIIRIKDGKITFKSEDHKNSFNRWVNQFKDNEYRLTIEDIKEGRSTSQNNYYWGVYLPLVSEETGHTVEELHEWAKNKFLVEYTKEIFGERVKKVKSSAILKVGEFQEYLFNIENETGVPLPNTTEYLGYSYHK